MDPAVEALAKEIVDWRATREPAWATEVGLPGHDHRLRASSTAAYLEELEECEALLARVEALPPSVDRDCLSTELGLQRFELAVARTWARNPDVALEYFDHLFSLLLASHLSDAQRVAALAARLAGCEAYFRDAWDRFDPEDTPPLWVVGARQTADGAAEMFAAVRAIAAAEPGGAKVLAALPAAEATLARHRAWLDDLHAKAKGTIPLGREAFEELLALRRIDARSDELLREGAKLVERFRQEVREAAVTVVSRAGHEPRHDVVEQALEVARKEHPATFADALAFHRKAIQDARSFVEKRNLATVPQIPVEVIETPPFLRHLIPFAAYIPPARFATPRRGVYLVTPKVDLASFAYSDVSNTIVHEAYPGHHLQLSHAVARPGLARFLADAPELVEGWALYCEWLMGHHGHTQGPGENLVRARDALWRAVRIVLDVGLATGTISPAEAASRLAEATGMTTEEADAEVLRYTQSPGYNLSYMWGRIQLLALRERALAAGVAERAFHDAVLGAGSVPVALLPAALREAGLKL